MALFPWDDWFYHISQKEQALLNLYQQYVTQKSTILVSGQSYGKAFEDYQTVLVNNIALIIATQMAMMKEDDFKSWLANLDTIPAPSKYNAIGFQIVEGTSELIGLLAFSRLLIKAGLPQLKNLIAAWRGQAGAAATEGGTEAATEVAGDLSEEVLEAAQGASGSGSEAAGSIAEEINDAITATEDELTDTGLSVAGDYASSSGDSLAELSLEGGSEAGTEAGIAAAEVAVEEATSASLATVAVTGAAIFIAVGLDAIMGAIQGAQESKQIAEQSAKIQKALDVVDGYIKKLSQQQADLEKKTVIQLQLFQVNVLILNKIMPLGSGLPLPPPTLQNLGVYKAVLAQAAATYGYLGVLRTDWQNFSSKHAPNPSWEVFAQEISDFAPPNLKPEQVTGFLNYVKEKIGISA